MNRRKNNATNTKAADNKHMTIPLNVKKKILKYKYFFNLKKKYLEI